MWRQYHRSLICILITSFLSPAVLHSEISTGVRIYNNRWHETWLMTPAPEVTLSTKWFAVQWDGTFGTYAPSAAPENYMIQYRLSLVPMMRLQAGPLESFLGYGLAYRFLREEIPLESNQWAFSSLQEVRGTFRFLLGLGISISERMNLHLNGGYHYQNEDNLAFSFGMSLGFKQTSAVDQPAPADTEKAPPADNSSDDSKFNSAQTPSEKKPAESPAALSPASNAASSAAAAESAGAGALSRKPIQTVCFIETRDKFINEINASLGASLIEKGIHVLSWEMIKTAVREHHQTQFSKTGDSSADRNDYLMDEMKIIINASSLFPLDAVIETKLRYIYETYGESILVNAAYVQLLNPQNAEPFMSIDFEKPESTFLECKTELTSKLSEELFHQD